MSAFLELINGEKPVLIDFTAAWCGPCQMMAPILDDVAKQNSGRLTIIKVDIDKNPNAANHFGIQSVPTLILIKKGEIIWRESGLQTAKQLMGVLNRYM